MAVKEDLLNTLLNHVPDQYDKQPGSFIYDALAPVAEQLVKTAQNIEHVKTQIDMERVSGEALEQRIRERTGIERKKATQAMGTVEVTGTGDIHQGDVFETAGGVQFYAAETKTVTDKGSVKIKAVHAGVNGNVAANTIHLFPVTLTGFTAVNNVVPTQDGFEAESDEELRKRYYERIQTPATSGNRAHYLHWAKEVDGVGDAHVIPLWDGKNSVKVVILGSDKKPASQAVVTAVQQYIDPDGEGLGNGKAPIGAKTTVVSAAGVDINLSVTAVLQSGYTLEEVTNIIRRNVEKYLRDIAFAQSTVSFAKIGAMILGSGGVIDYRQLQINNGTTNLSIGKEQVAVLGGVSVVT